MSSRSSTRTAPARLASLAIAVVLTMAAAACGSSSHSTATAAAATARRSTKPVSGGSLVVGIPTESPGWNPSSDEWDDTGNLVGSTVLEPLATAGADAGPSPGWRPAGSPTPTSPSGSIKLRRGVQFQDGTPFNAQAVVDNFDAYLASPFYTLTLGPIFRASRRSTT